MATVKRYSKEEVNLFPEMLAKLVMVMEKCVQKGDMQDVMGPIFHELNLHSKYKGQFFTPQNISDMMAKMLVSEKDMDVERRGFTTICEPACGSGVMVISFAKAMQEAGYNYCRQMVVECTDIDLKCVHMAYIQLSLYGIPAVVIHGNSLAMEEWSRWYTPVYILERWTEKMNRRQDYEQDQTGH